MQQSVSIFWILYTAIWIIVPCIFIYQIITSIIYYLAKQEMCHGVNDEKVEKFIGILHFKIIRNHPNSWNDLRSMFFHINNADNVSVKMKEKAYEVIRSKGCNLGNVRINKPKNQIIKKQEELAKESGRKGEENVAYYLKWLDPRYKVLHNVKLNHKIEAQEFDTIIIGPNGIFHIETKNEGGINGCKIIIDDDGNWRRVDAYREVAFRNPVSQVYRHTIVLKDMLNQNFGEGVYDIVGVIVLANDKTIIEGSKNCEVPVIKADSLMKFVTNYKETKQLSIDEIENITEKINSIKLDNK